MDATIASVLSILLEDSICGTIVFNQKKQLLFANKAAHFVAEFKFKFLSDEAGIVAILEDILKQANSEGIFYNLAVGNTFLSGTIKKIPLNDQTFLAFQFRDDTDVVKQHLETKLQSESLANANVNIAMMFSDLEELNQIIMKQAKIESEAAKMVQDTLFPKVLNIPDVELAFFSMAAAKTGGDWCGYHHDKISHRIYFFIGDVTGHGFPSALITAVACGAIYSSERYADLLAQNKNNSTESAILRLRNIAEVTNQLVRETGALTSRLMTMFFTCLDLKTGELIYLNAGHNHPLMIKKSSHEVRVLTASGNRLGYTDNPNYRIHKVILQPEDIIFMYTDGLIENITPTGQQLSVKKIKEAIKNASSVTEVKEKVLSISEDIWKTAPPEDDLSFLTFAWKNQT